MQFTCNKDLLSEGISNVQKAVSTRSTLSILEGILIEVENNKLRLTGYDLEMGIHYTMPAQCEENGKIVLNSRIFGDIVRRFSDDEIYVKTDKNDNIMIQCGQSTYNLKGMDANTYPEMPETKETEGIQLLQKDLRNLIRRSIFSVSTDLTRPNLNGCNLNSKNNVLEMVGIDGYRMAISILKSDEEKNQKFIPMEFTIPTKSLRDLLSLLDDNGKEEVKLSLSQNQLVFDFGRNRLISRLITDPYLDYKKVMPSEMSTEIKISTKALLNSIERSVLMVTQEDKRSPVTLKCSGPVLFIDSVTNRGNFHEEIDVQFTGEEIDVDLNPRFLIEALKAVDDDNIRIFFSGSLGPCIIKPLENEEYVFLILPLRR